MKNRKGFSLIGMVIAIAVASILIGVGIASTGTYVDESKVVKAKAEVSVMEIAISSYNIDYPKAKIESGQISDATISLLKSKGYIQKTPAFMNAEGCSYSFQKINNSTQPHVVLSGCKFSKDNISVY